MTEMVERTSESYPDQSTTSATVLLQCIVHNCACTVLHTVWRKHVGTAKQGGVATNYEENVNLINISVSVMVSGANCNNDDFLGF